MKCKEKDIMDLIKLLEPNRNNTLNIIPISKKQAKKVKHLLEQPNEELIQQKYKRLVSELDKAGKPTTFIRTEIDSDPNAGINGLINSLWQNPHP